MNFTAFLRKRLCDLLDDRRIVVWYDPAGAFAEFVSSFKAPRVAVAIGAGLIFFVFCLQPLVRLVC